MLAMVTDGPAPAIISEDHNEELNQTLEVLREDAEVSRALLGLAAALAEVRTVAETLELAVRMVPEMLGADRCFAATWDRLQDRFTIHARWGFRPDLEELNDHLAATEGFPVLRSALHGDKAPLLVADVTTFPVMKDQDVKLRDLGAYVGIPLTRNGEELGVLALEYERAREFGGKEEALTLSIGRLVSTALVNARRFTQLDELRGFSLRLGRVLRLNPVIEEVTSGAERLLDGDGAGLYLAEATRLELLPAARRGAGTSGDFARIQLKEEPWTALAEGRTIHVPASEGRFQPEGGIPLSIVASPILGASSTIVGAIVVFFERSVALGVDQVDALEVLAAQSAMAIENAQRFERQRRVARSLQRGLLATDVTPVEGFRIGTVYEPATDDAEVGGDFFDVFDLSEGRIGVVVGDVSGKGAEAAALTAQAKYMLRAFASRNPSPASALFHLNNSLERALDDDRFATALFATIDPKDRTGQISVAGHPFPLIYRAATGEVEVVEPKGGLLGCFPEEQYEQSAYELDPGDVLFACTDGLLEARSGTDLYGTERLIAALKRLAPIRSDDELARSIFEDAREFGSIRDDTVVIVMSFDGIISKVPGGGA
jgi:serine phosphatase RsbU (regulator of sigma subunit)